MGHHGGRAGSLPHARGAGGREGQPGMGWAPPQASHRSNHRARRMAPEEWLSLLPGADLPTAPTPTRSLLGRVVRGAVSPASASPGAVEAAGGVEAASATEQPGGAGPGRGRPTRGLIPAFQTQRCGAAAPCPPQGHSAREAHPPCTDGRDPSPWGRVCGLVRSRRPHRHLLCAVTWHQLYASGWEEALQGRG